MYQNSQAPSRSIHSFFSASGSRITVVTLCITDIYYNYLNIPKGTLSEAFDLEGYGLLVAISVCRSVADSVIQGRCMPSSQVLENPPPKAGRSGFAGEFVQWVCEINNDKALLGADSTTILRAVNQATNVGPVPNFC
jgi:hypothetical protein